VIEKVGRLMGDYVKDRANNLLSRRRSQQRFALMLDLFPDGPHPPFGFGQQVEAEKSVRTREVLTGRVAFIAPTVNAGNTNGSCCVRRS